MDRRKTAAPRPSSLLGLAALGLVLTACADDRRGDPNLAVACAVKACECAPESGEFGSEVTPVLWQDNGDAYCPTGFALRLADTSDYAPRELPDSRQPGGIGFELSF